MSTNNFLKYIRLVTYSPSLEVGHIAFNTETICNCLEEINSLQPNIVLFPELCVTGYTCADLFHQSKLIEDSKKAVLKIAQKTKQLSISCVIGAPLIYNQQLYNTAVFISNGSILGIVPKIYLPNTREYYEKRWFVSGKNIINKYIILENKQIPFGIDLLFSPKGFSDCNIGIEICEDLWAVIPQSSSLALSGANIILNLSASNDVLGKQSYRKKLVEQQSARCVCVYAYTSANANESTTDLLYSGSMFIAENGKILQEHTEYTFESKYLLADVDIEMMNHDRRKNSSFYSHYQKQEANILLFNTNLNPSIFEKKLHRFINSTPFVPSNLKDRNQHCTEIFSMQQMALAKRLKHLKFLVSSKIQKKIVIGLSGGIDSTLALLVCIQSLKTIGLTCKNIYAMNLPAEASSQHTIENTKQLCKILGISLEIIPISKALKQHWEDIKQNPNEYDVTYENAQARERTQILMDKANQKNGIVIGTSNLSEIALGWCTYNGDHISMYHINSGIPKTIIQYIIEWYANNHLNIKEVLYSILKTPISPELIPHHHKKNISLSFQETEKIIGPYLLHDFFLFYTIRYGFSSNKILFLAKTAFQNKYSEQKIKKYLNLFYQRFYNNQFKRSAMPDGIKVGSISLSPRGDWKMPSDAFVLDKA